MEATCRSGSGTSHERVTNSSWAKYAAGRGSRAEFTLRDSQGPGRRRGCQAGQGVRSDHRHGHHRRHPAVGPDIPVGHSSLLPASSTSGRRSHREHRLPGGSPRPTWAGRRGSGDGAGPATRPGDPGRLRSGARRGWEPALAGALSSPCVAASDRAVVTQRIPVERVGSSGGSVPPGRGRTPEGGLPDRAPCRRSRTRAPRLR